MENNELEEQLAELEKLHAQLESTEVKSEEEAEEVAEEAAEEAAEEVAEEVAEEAEEKSEEQQLAELEELHAKLENTDQKADAENMTDLPRLADFEGAISVYMSDIRFKEAMEAGDLINEEAFNALDEEEKKGYEVVNVIDEKTEEPMGWAFRYKVSEDEDAEEKGYGSMHDRDDKDEDDMKDMFETAAEAAERAVELGCEGSHGHDNGMFMPCADMETYTDLMSKKGYGSMNDDDDDDKKKKKKEDTAEMAEKASRILENLTREADEDEDENPDVPSVFLSKADFDDKCHTGEYLNLKEYGDLDEDAKEAFELVQIYDEDSEKGYGMRYRRRNPMKRNIEYKEKFFDSAEDAAEAATALGCSGAHEADGKFLPCENPEEYAKLTGQGEAEGMERMKSEDFLCGFQRKSVAQPCDFCRGGCAPEGDLPGLADIEAMVKSAYEGSEVVGSGYSSADDIFVLDVKRADGSAVEIFISGEGEELGWLKIDEQLLEEKSIASVDIISQVDAESAAVKAIGGEVYSVSPDIFNNEDVYVVQLETADQKSFDVFVGMDGKVLGYDEYQVELPLSDEEEIKALEAELELKRMYSREQREEMAENGDALPDGSFPIADEADLRNAIQAYGRAADKEAAKGHIMKRAEELGLEDMIPDDWMVGSGEDNAAPEAPETEAPQAEQMEEEKTLDDLGIDIDEALKEFESLKEEFDGLS